MIFKTCTKCKEEKEIITFKTSKTIKSGYEAQCKKCTNKERQEWLKNNKDKRLLYNKTQKIKRNLNRKKIKEKNKCIICDISLKNYQINRKVCKDCYKIYKRGLNKNYKEYQKNYQRNYHNINREEIIKKTKNRRVLLTDSYCKKLLVETHGFTNQQISDNPELIELKRAIVKTKRLWQTLKI